MESIDLERLAVVAYLTGRDTESTAAWERAHSALVEEGDLGAAIRCGFWLAFGLLNRGEFAQGGGWLARLERLVGEEEGLTDCGEKGYLLMPIGLQALEGGDASEALAAFGEVVELGRSCSDSDLQLMGRLGRGQALIRLGETERGLRLLDEVMVAVSVDDVSPIVAGLAYCALIETCSEIFDLRRAQEWTQVLTRWCEAQPDLVPYRGQCLVHRSELMQLEGAWLDAVKQADRACDRLGDPPGQPALGMAFYQRAELSRLRGDVDRAERLYRQAEDRGRRPEPGRARLLLAEGHTRRAREAVEAAVSEELSLVARIPLLAAQVDIALADADVASARGAAVELAEAARALDAPAAEAMAAYADGAVLFADTESRQAIRSLRRALGLWSEIPAPYEMARTRVLIGRARLDLDDVSAAMIELGAAREIFAGLGAALDVQVVDRLSGEPDGSDRKLTRRQTEVLALVATGMTNRQIAAELVISEKTVARHVSDIFTRLGVSTRAAATRYAFEHGSEPH
ncbi:MAG: LuxR C-terminal-related transcriptional regulator [Acidimicrobiales bacterium]